MSTTSRLGTPNHGAPIQRATGGRRPSSPLAAVTRPGVHVSARDLPRIVTRIASAPGLWRPAVRFGTADRYWTRLPAPEGVDVWLLTWMPSQGTDLHDHGDSSAAFAVVEGAVTEVRVDPVAGMSSAVLSPPSVGVVAPGVVHDVRNDSSRPAVSIHAYFPRLTRMTYYDVQDGLLVPQREVLGDEPEVAE